MHVAHTVVPTWYIHTAIRPKEISSHAHDRKAKKKHPSVTRREREREKCLLEKKPQK